MTSILKNLFVIQSGKIFQPAAPYYVTEVIPCPSLLPDSTCNCTGKNTIPLDETQCQKVNYLNVTWPEEGTCLVALLLIGAALYMLQDFIKEYAFSLVDRQNHVQQLTKQNADLRSQLKAMKKDVDLDLESPITKVIKMIRNIQDKCDLEADMMESLDYVISILSSNQLFLPNLDVNKDAMDSDVQKWLKAMMTNTQGNAPLGRGGEVVMSQTDLSQGHMDAIVKPIQANESRIVEVLRGIDQWGFDIFELREVTDGRPLYYLGLHISEKYNFRNLFSVDDSVLRNFLAKIEAGYKANPYHNSTHAADVLHAIYYFVSVLGLKELVTAEDCFAGVIAASIHDLEHPGVNNAFLINSQSPLALRYNDLAVLENHHCARAFELMTTDESCNVLSRFSSERLKAIRSSILSMVLATDMSSHFEYIAKFKNKISGAGLNFSDTKDCQLVMDIAMKCGDISNATKPTELCKKWAALIMEEFFQQGDQEKEKGLPVSMFMDRTNTVIPKCQVGFIDYIVTPLYEVWDQYLNEDGSYEAFSNLAKNREYWKRQQELELQGVQVVAK
ncbi:High affinity cAMP-specific 3',5'-cyclic phosphodiesterase 7A [Rhizophlyctis rosea]|uniref:Phosphodiesterase n=1 Tax=Rhizophlyctis rosea TaxID=64517 RepID=A0AAD5X756_9FUNG|nr:High affinity cAMP-specific 3',5'-cyclic phosphodiesterase 7A [Rhizophlyctis rosea]